MLTYVFRSYTCGGVGHLSRDCVQGSKCYNCSGIVRFFIGSFQYKTIGAKNLLAGAHQQGLPAAPEEGMLYVRL